MFRTTLFLKRAALVLVSLLVGLATAEAALRLAGISYPPPALFFQPDRNTGWSHLPGAAGEFRREGFSKVRISSAGLRDREHLLAKPTNVFRVAVLGDSMTEALQVPEEKNFCSVLERQLQQCSMLRGRQPEVINFGVMGYGTAQELIMLRRKVWQYSPDMVILAFAPINDVIDNSPFLQEFEPDQLRGARPFFYSDRGHLQLDSSFQTSLARIRINQGLTYGSAFRRFLWEFRIGQLLLHVRDKYKSGPLAIIWRGASVTKGFFTNGSRAFDPFAAAEAEAGYVLNPPPDQAWRSGWRLSEAIITQMAREVRDQHKLFLLVVLSEPLQVFPGPNARETLLKEAHVEDPFYPNERLEALARREGLEFLSLSQPLQQYADARGVFLHGFPDSVLGYGHYNELGHRLVGDMIAGRICELIAAPEGVRPQADRRAACLRRSPSHGSETGAHGRGRMLSSTQRLASD